MGFIIENLKNTTPLEINISRIGQGAETPENIKNYAANELGQWMLTTSIGLFIGLWAYYYFVKRYSAAETTLFSSIWSWVAVWAFTITGFTRDIYPHFFFITLIMLSTIWVYIRKKKGLDQ